MTPSHRSAFRHLVNGRRFYLTIFIAASLCLTVWKGPEVFSRVAHAAAVKRASLALETAKAEYKAAPRAETAKKLEGAQAAYNALVAAPAATPAVQSETTQLSESALRQLEAILAEKESRTPEEQKMDSQLVYALKRFQGTLPAELASLEIDVEMDAKGKVLCDITSDDPVGMAKDLEREGNEVLDIAGNNVRARISLEEAEHCARVRGVQFVARAAKAMTSRELARERQSAPVATPDSLPTNHKLPGTFAERAARVRTQLTAAMAKMASAAPATAPATMMATNVSQGDVAHRAAEARSFFGVDGTGIKIGVLSDSASAARLAALQASGDLPAVTVLPGQGGAGSDEGAAMLEIVHDLAPGAQLYFATAFTSITSFGQNIRDLRAAGCDIIIDDVFYFAEAVLQDGQASSVVSPNNMGAVTQAVNDVTASGAMYFSSAGNQGNLNDNTSRAWEGDFVSAQTIGSGVLTGDALDFNTTAGVSVSSAILSASSSNLPVSLQWSDPLGQSSNDYDLFILDSTLTTVQAASTNVQNGNDDPLELVGGATPGRRIVVIKRSTAAARFVSLRNFRGRIQFGTNGITSGHSAAAGACSVAAVDQATAGGGAFTGGAANPVETFSSDGERKLFFQPDGTLINTGNPSLLADGGTLRQKPDIAAADGVATATPGFNPFFGTSAAAPHAGAIAALVWSANLALTSTQVKNALKNSALDIEAPGTDRDSGAGIVMAYQALEEIGATPKANLIQGTVAATPINTTDPNGVVDPCETANLTFQISNIGGANATNVSATLTSSTPGVTILNGTAAYPNIPAPGMATNLTPFTFKADCSVACGAVLNFTLTLNYSGGSSPRTFNFTVPTGAAQAPVTVSYAGPVLPIPDGSGADVPGAPAVATLNVSGLTGGIADLNFKFGGTSCTNTIGATTVGLDHTFVGDLVIKLKSPQGTEVTIINRLSNGGGGNSGNNFCNTLLDDEAATLVQPLTSVSAPFTGSFIPANALSAFDGENPNGMWTLTVQDFFVGDTGNIRAWSLDITPRLCMQFADLTLTKTQPATALAGGLLDDPITVVNNGPNAANNVVVSVPLPANTTFWSASAPGGWTPSTPAVGATGTVTFTKPTMAVNESATFAVQVRVNANVACTTILTGTAAVSSSTLDPNTLDNQAEATTQIRTQSDVSITKQVTPAQVFAGQQVTYTLNVANAQFASDSSSNIVTDTLPAGFTVTSANASQGSCGVATAAGVSTVTCNLGALAANGSATITIVANVPKPYSAATVTNTATVTPSGNCDLDPIANNTATVSHGINVFETQVGDPLVCISPNGLVSVTATITNNNAAPVNANFTATLPTTLIGLPGTGLASINPGGINVTAAAVTWTGTIPANTTVTITYKTQVAANAPANTPLCVGSEVSFDGNPPARVQACVTLNCPPGPVNVGLSDQKAGSLLVFPYYVSKAADKKDTRMTISNVGARTAAVHLFFLDGTTCNQADQFLCLTPNASFAFKASEYDPEATGWVLAVAVDDQGRPIQYNGLIGNAFVNDGNYVDNYGAESFRANSPLVATINNNAATLYFDNSSYEAVPNQFAIEIQSPLSAPGQRIVTVGLQGDLTTNRLSGAAQVGPGLAINGNEKPFGSFSAWLNGGCQAQAMVSTTSPRVPTGTGALIPAGQVGTIRLNVGAGLGLIMTPRTTNWSGIRTLHKTGLTTATLTIPVFAPVC